ncbi:hypothetical protein BDW69DRAFT_154408 [Aspergillus filifer]
MLQVSMLLYALRDSTAYSMMMKPDSSPRFYCTIDCGDGDRGPLECIDLSDPRNARLKSK